jgi:hypothetical protein
MNAEDYWNIAAAVLTSLGGGAIIVAAFSSWLGKVWANRILEKDRAKYQTEIELLKSDLDKKIHEHNVAVSRIDAQRAAAIQSLYATLIAWFEVALEVRAPNKKLDEEKEEIAIAQYQQWGDELKHRSEDLAKLAMHTAILLKPDTYGKILKCGHTASMLSIDFYHASFSSGLKDPKDILKAIKNAREELEKKYQDDFEPAREALINEFRNIIDPTIKL